MQDKWKCLNVFFLLLPYLIICRTRRDIEIVVACSTSLLLVRYYENKKDALTIKNTFQVIWDYVIFTPYLIDYFIAYALRSTFVLLVSVAVYICLCISVVSLHCHIPYLSFGTFCNLAH